MFQFVVNLPLLIFSIILHEVAHGWAAERCGDDTARIMGRLTFNPVPHIDPIGSILLPIVTMMTGAPIFGWAKPVPINPYRFNNPKRDMALVSLAGPMSNILLALTCALVMNLLRNYPILPSTIILNLYYICNYLMVINVILPIFNLLPVPPLDGSKVLMSLLPHNLAVKYAQLEQYGFLIVILLLTTNVISTILGPVVNTILTLLGGR